jgi:hypothetical protein
MTSLDKMKEILPMRSLLLALVALCALPACGDFTFSRDLEGTVTNVGSRFQGASEGAAAQQKISLLVKATKSDPKIDEVAAGPSGVAIECLSTRCASIPTGTCHHFACKFEIRFLEPDVISCKHVKEIECLVQGPATGLRTRSETFDPGQ